MSVATAEVGRPLCFWVCSWGWGPANIQSANAIVEPALIPGWRLRERRRLMFPDMFSVRRSSACPLTNGYLIHQRTLVGSALQPGVGESRIADFGLSTRLLEATARRVFGFPGDL